MTTASTMPKTIRAYATIRFKEPIPEGFVLSTDESFTISINGRDYQMDFEDCEFAMDTLRQTVSVMWKNPDLEAFGDTFQALTLDVLKNADIKLNDNLNRTIVAENPFNEENRIDIEEIVDMELASPYDEFKEVNLINS